MIAKTASPTSIANDRDVGWNKHGSVDRIRLVDANDREAHRSDHAQSRMIAKSDGIKRKCPQDSCGRANDREDCPLDHDR